VILLFTAHDGNDGPAVRVRSLSRIQTQEKEQRVIPMKGDVR
jgi:hypothetical protein